MMPKSRWWMLKKRPSIEGLNHPLEELAFWMKKALTRVWPIDRVGEFSPLCKLNALLTLRISEFGSKLDADD